MNNPDKISDLAGRPCQEPIPADLGHTHMPVGYAQGMGTMYSIWLRFDRAQALVTCASGPAETVVWKYEADLESGAPDPYLVAMLWAINETAEEVHDNDRLGAGAEFARYSLAR